MYKVTRCTISLDHVLFGSISVSKGECTTEKLPPLQGAQASASSKPCVFVSNETFVATALDQGGEGALSHRPAAVD
jgi:hypothetical protein